MFRKLALSVCTFFIAATAFAQTAQPPQRPTGTGTPALQPTTMTPQRPIGTGTPALPPTMTTPSQRPSGTGFPALPPTTTATPPQPIFRVDDISRALTLNDRQLQQLNAMTQRLQQQYQSQYDRLGSVGERDRTNRLMELNRDYTNAWLGAAKNVLTPTQLSQYQQLQVQLGGFTTFNDPAIQRGLNLTNGQIQRLNDAFLASNAQLQDITRLAQTDPVRARTAYANYVQDYENRLNLILSVEQQRQWTQMTGEPFPFPPPFGTGQ